MSIAPQCQDLDFGVRLRRVSMVREPKIVMIHASGEIERLSTKDAEAAVSYREVSPMAVSRIDDETTIAELPDARSALRLSPPIVLR